MMCTTEQKAATKYCPDCKLDLCGDCTTTIHSIKGLSKHQVVDLSKKASVMGPPLCEVHKGRPKDLYCIDCKVSGCEADLKHQFLECLVPCFLVHVQCGMY